MPRRLPSRAVLALALLAAAGCRSSSLPPVLVPAPEATRRALAAGEVTGGEGRYGSHAWLGIPYAKPPVGALRWRAPSPIGRFEGPLAATSFGAPCPQYASPFAGVDGKAGTIQGSEDCLTLDVWTPRFAGGVVPVADERLPVLVWIHGGGNSIGTTRFYDGGNLATSENVVVVAVQYRLGPLGWMRHAALRAGASDDVERSGNFATLDLIAALAFVRDHIAAFGGDPDNVTIFGESAGGTNVFTLLLAPQARGLFHRAIVQSGGLGFSSPEEAEAFADSTPAGHVQSSSEILLRLLEKDGAKGIDAAKAELAAMSDAEIAGYLRGKTPEALLAAYVPDPSGMIPMPKTFPDGVVLPVGDPLARFATTDGWNRVPVVLGTNRDENRLFLFPNERYVERVLWIFPRFVDEELFFATADAQSRMWKATGVDAPAAAMRRVEPRVFAYRFDWDEEPSFLGADLSKFLGASHGFEIPFVFGHFDLGRASGMVFDEKGRESREALSKAMRSYWAAFAKRGDPGRGSRGELDPWLAFDASAPATPRAIVFDTASGGGIRMTDETESPAGVIARVMADPRLDTPARRCDVLGVLARWSRGYTAADYASNPDCAAFPLEGMASH